MEQLITDDDIKIFKKKNIYGDIILEIRKKGKKLFHLTPFGIINSFSWRESPQGYDFWCKTYYSISLREGLG